MYFGGRKDNDSEYKSLINKETMKPSDVRNGDLVSLLLAANPPYLYNMPLVPQTFFFSEMLRSFVQAKAERQNIKTHLQSRRRKRSWRESIPDNDKPLELTTPRTPEKEETPPVKRSSSFTAEKLANSSVPNVDLGNDVPPNPSGSWYHPSLYPNQPVDPLHFFIDLRVSAHIWDQKMSEEQKNEEDKSLPLDLQASSSQNRQFSAFSAPPAKKIAEKDTKKPKSLFSVHHILKNLKDSYAKIQELKDDNSVKEESDQSEDDEKNLD